MRSTARIGLLGKNVVMCSDVLTRAMLNGITAPIFRDFLTFIYEFGPDFLGLIDFLFQWMSYIQGKYALEPIR